MNAALTLFGRYGLKEGNLLLYFAALAFWALEFFLFIFRNLYIQGERLIAFFTDELVDGHAKLLLHMRFSRTRNKGMIGFFPTVVKRFRHSTWPMPIQLRSPIFPSPLPSP